MSKWHLLIRVRQTVLGCCAAMALCLVQVVGDLRHVLASCWALHRSLFVQRPKKMTRKGGRKRKKKRGGVGWKEREEEGTNNKSKRQASNKNLLLVQAAWR